MIVLERDSAPGQVRASQASDAEAFLRTQADALDAALRNAHDCEALDRAIAIHARSHESWLAVLSALTAHGDRAAALELGNLYALCGRIAETLEREDCGRLGLPFDDGLRRILADRLELRATASVAAVRRLDDDGHALG